MIYSFALHGYQKKRVICQALMSNALDINAEQTRYKSQNKRFIIILAYPVHFLGVFMC